MEDGRNPQGIGGNGPLWGDGRDDPVAAIHIRQNADGGQALCGQKGRDGLALRRADFQQQAPAGGKMGRGGGGKDAVGAQTIAKVGQRAVRFMVADLGGEARHFIGGNIGRVRDDQVEAACHIGQPVRKLEGGAIREGEARGVVLCHGQRGGGDVGAKACRLWPLGQQRQQDAAGAGAEVKDAREGLGQRFGQWAPDLVFEGLAVMAALR